MKQYRFFDLITAVFVTVLLISNIASSAKIVDWGVNLLGVPMAFDAGVWCLSLEPAPHIDCHNYLFKCGVEALMTPVTYVVVGALKRAEVKITMIAIRTSIHLSCEFS